MTTAKLPTKSQFLFLKIVASRGTEKSSRRAVDGVPWSSQQAAEKAGWVTTRPGNVCAWETWYVITPAGQAAIEAYRAAQKAAALDMKPYNLAPPAPNPYRRNPKHPRTCGECGICRPRRLTSRKAPRQAAKRETKEPLDA